VRVGDFDGSLGGECLLVVYGAAVDYRRALVLQASSPPSLPPPLVAAAVAGCPVEGHAGALPPVDAVTTLVVLLALPPRLAAPPTDGRRLQWR